MKISEDHSTGGAAVRNKTQLWSKLQLTTWRQMEGQRQTAPWEGLAPTSLVRAVCKGNRMQMGVKAAKRHGKRGDNIKLVRWTSVRGGRDESLSAVDVQKRSLRKQVRFQSSSAWAWLCFMATQLTCLWPPSTSFPDELQFPGDSSLAQGSPLWLHAFSRGMCFHKPPKQRSEKSSKY